MEQGKEYYAFISYKREDEKWAKWLQHKLEHYHFPINFNGRSDLPKYIRPTFRDVTDLTPGLLAEEIDKALRSSEWLVIICSPRSAKSPWVCKEAQTFIDQGRADHIIPFVIEGIPFSNDTSLECYPEALLNLTGSHELLAANVNEMGRDAAAIKVVAKMFNLRFDTLWQRHKRAENIQKRKMKEERWRALFSQGRTIAYIAKQQIQLCQIYRAAQLLLAVSPSSLKKKKRPIVPEVVGGLRQIYDILHYSDKYHPVCFFSGPNDNSCISSNGSLLCYPINYKIYVFNITDGKLIKVFERDDIAQEFSIGVAFSHSGRSLAVTTSVGFEVWDTKTWTLLLREKFKEEEGIEMNNIVFGDTDSKLVMTSQKENVVVLYDMKSHSYCFIGGSDTYPVIATLNHAENQVAVLGNTNEVTLYKLNGEVICTYQYSDCCTDVYRPRLQYSIDDNCLYFCSEWDPLQEIDIVKGKCNYVEKSLNNNRLKKEDFTKIDALFIENKLFPLLLTMDLSIIVEKTCRQFAKEYYELSVCEDKKMIIGRNKDLSVVLFQKGDRIRAKRFISSKCYRRIDFVEDTTLAVVCSISFIFGYGGCLEIDIWDYERDKKVFQIPLKGRTRIASYTLDHSHAILYVLYGDGLVLGWNIKTLDEVFEYLFKSSVEYTGQHLAQFFFDNSSDPKKRWEKIKDSISEDEYKEEMINFNEMIAGDICYADGFLFATIRSHSEFEKEIRRLDIYNKKEYLIKDSLHGGVETSLIYMKPHMLLLNIDGLVHTWSTLRITEKPVVWFWCSSLQIMKIVICSHEMIAVLQPCRLSMRELNSDNCKVEIILPEVGNDMLYIKRDNLIVVKGESGLIYFYNEDDLSLVYTFNCYDYYAKNKKFIDPLNHCFSLSPNGNIIVDGWELEYPCIEDVYNDISCRFKNNRLKEKDLTPRSDFSGGQLLI